MQSAPTQQARKTATSTAKRILRDLVEIPTITADRSMNNKALTYIDQFLEERGMHMERFEWNGVRSLVATTKKTKTPTVFFMGHIDVVPASEDHFNFVERDGRYYGRGVLDMKSGIAAYMTVVDELRDSLSEYDFGIMIVTDEEEGGFNGAAKLAEAGYIPKVMVIMDGAGDWNMERGAKGVWHSTIEARGKSAHGSRPWEGDNAVDKIIAVLQDFKAYFPDVSPENNTINVGNIRGGHAINQIPAQATVGIDIRFLHRGEYERLRGALQDILKRYDAVMTEEVYGEAMENDIANPYLTAYKYHTEKTIGRNIHWMVANAGSDGRWFSPAGVPCAISYPPGGGHHGAEEWIDAQEFERMTDIFISYLQDVAKLSD